MDDVKKTKSFGLVRFLKFILFTLMLGVGGFFWFSQSPQEKIEALIKTDPALAASKLDGYINKGDIPEWVKQDFPIAYFKLIEVDPALAASKIEKYLKLEKEPAWIKQDASAAYFRLIEVNPELVVKRLDRYQQQDETPKWVKQYFSIAYFKLIEVNPALAANKIEKYLNLEKEPAWIKQDTSAAYFRLIEVNPELVVKRLDRYQQQDEIPKWVKQNFSIAYLKSIQTHSGMIDYYDTFRTLMNLSVFSDIKDNFKFIETLEKDDADNQLFAGNKDQLETYYFYYDTGRFFPYQRGFALTEKSLIWKNMFHSVHTISFDDINHISLQYDRGFSLNGWNLMVNNDEDLTIRLSEVEDEDLLNFINNLLMFINSNRNFTTQIILEIPPEEQQKLQQNFLERHGEEIVVAGTMIIEAYFSKGNIQSPAKSVRSIKPTIRSLSKSSVKGLRLSAKSSDKFSKFMRGITAKVGTVLRDAKARGVSLGRAISVHARELPKSFKSFDVYKSGKVIGKYKIKDLYRSEDIVRMPYKGIKGINVANKFSKKSWQQFSNNPEVSKALSKTNKKLIAAGEYPKVDRTWVKHNPSFKKLYEQNKSMKEKITLSDDHFLKIKGITGTAPVSYRGFERNKKYFWGKFLENPEASKALSPTNRKLIAKGRSPTVDSQWIKHHPTHERFKGESLEHHHVYHGAKVIPLPRTLHRGANNKMIWHVE